MVDGNSRRGRVPDRNPDTWPYARSGFKRPGEAATSRDLAELVKEFDMGKPMHRANLYVKGFHDVEQGDLCRMVGCKGKRFLDIQYGVCMHHALLIHRRICDMIKDELVTPEILRDKDRRDLERKAALDAASVVYYVQIGDRIKIGYTSQLANRMSAFRGVMPDAVKLLAHEPGDRRVERKRHAQFAEHRVGRTELFEPCPELLQHIAELR